MGGGPRFICDVELVVVSKPNHQDEQHYAVPSLLQDPESCWGIVSISGFEPISRIVRRSRPSIPCV